jgi:hypothetical protein
MATVIFAPFIQQHVSCPPMEVFGNTMREILEGYFEKHRRVREYILDERGCLRPRLALYVDGVIATDRRELSEPVHARAQVHICPMPADTEYESLD